jgi:hypothetical protein
MKSCLRSIQKSGMSSTPIYRRWCDMRARCQNPSHQLYKWYGARGINVCAEWGSFLQFYSDMGAGYQKGLQLDRIDNSKGYSKDNCRWASNREQLYNRTCTRRFLYEGEQCTALEIIERAGLSGKVRRDQMYGMLSRHTAEEAVAIYKTKLTTEE